MTLNLGGYVSELTFDGTDLQPDDHSFVLWISRGLTAAPSVRGEDSVVPHAAGRVALSRQADLLRIELDGWIFGATPAGFRTTQRALMNLFDGVAEPRVLSCLLEDGVATATINARPQPPVLVDEIIPSHLARVNVALESVDPYWVVNEGS